MHVRCVFGKAHVFFVTRILDVQTGDEIALSSLQNTEKAGILYGNPPRRLHNIKVIAHASLALAHETILLFRRISGDKLDNINHKRSQS